MAQSTKLALAASLKKLLQKKSLDDITVKEIVEDCQVNRQTFYYHFQDIFDLLRFFLEHETNEALQGSTSLREALLRAFCYARDNHTAVYRVFRSSGRDHLDCQFYSLARTITYAAISECSQDLDLTDRDRNFLADFYMYALAGLMIGWMAHDMREEPEELAEQIDRLMRGEFRRAAEAFAGHGAPPEL